MRFGKVLDIIRNIEELTIDEELERIEMVTKSRSSIGKRHHTFIDFRHNKYSCTCNAFIYIGNCKHIEVAKFIYKRYSKLHRLLSHYIAKIIIKRPYEEVIIQWGKDNKPTIKLIVLDKKLHGHL